MSLVLTPQREGRFHIGRHIAHEVDFGRFPLLLPAFAVLGIGLWMAAPRDPPLLVLVGLTLALLIARVVLNRWAGAAAFAPIATLFAAVLAGACAVGLQSAFIGTPMVERATTVTLSGTIRAVDRLGPKRQRAIIIVEDSTLEGPSPRHVRLVVRGQTPLQVGSTITAKARLFPIRGPVTPGGYDPSRRLYFDGVGATGFVYGAPEVVPPERRGLHAMISAARQGVVARIVAADPPAPGFAAAILVGERGLMPAADVEALRVAGLGHILAISGLHMALFAGSVFAAVRASLALFPSLALRYPIKKWAAVAGLVAATLYLGLSGASVATVRAYLMLVIAMVAILCDRPALTMRSVALAASILIIIDPASVLEPGFQMSFLAVVALVGAYEWWSAVKVKRKKRPLHPLAAICVGLLSTSLIAGLATAPAAAFHFDRVAPLGLIGNMAAMPIFTFIAMPAGIVSLFSMPLGLEALPLKVMGAALSMIVAIAKEVATWTGSSGATGGISGLSFALIAAGLLFAAVMTSGWRILGAGAVLAGLVLIPLDRSAHLYVAGDGVSAASRTLSGELVLSSTTSAYAGQKFLAADGDTRPVNDAKQENCDPRGCALPLLTQWVALVHSPRALAEDCARASVVISTGTVRRCVGPVVIDRGQLIRHGAHALYREGDSWRVVTARPYGISRPWHVPVPPKDP
ncbi:MAG: ComEC/Rec2 family competence protein [Pseudomonadota bacterium]